MSYGVGMFGARICSPLGVFLSAFVVACSGAEPPAALCQADSQCETGEVCQSGDCLLPAKLDCVEGGSAKAVLLAEPDPLDFGIVGTELVTRSLTIGNLGDCNLKIVQAEIEGGANSRFVCAGCLQRTFPIRVFPGRGVRLDMTVQPGAPGRLEERLILATNDPGNREYKWSLIAESAGLPALRVDPLAIDFGFVAPGATGERIVQAINSSDGSANLTVDSVAIDPADSPAFSVASMTPLPVTLAPASVDPSARAAFTVRYDPTEQMSYAAELVVTPKYGAQIRVPLSSLGEPPSVSVTPMHIDLGAIRLGETAFGIVTVQNTGRADLVGTTSLQVGGSNDLTISGRQLRIAPGGLTELGVIYEPTRGGSIGDSIIIQTNDPMQPRILISVSGTAVAAAEQVVSVEMTFEADSSSTLDKDLRDVDLFLESPLGLVVHKNMPQGGWGPYGAARWSSTRLDALERVVLGRVTQDGDFLVSLSYIEDCSTLPTALASAILGIGADELVLALSDDAVAIDPAQLAAAVQQTCVQRRSTTATLVTTVDGTQVDSREVRLNQKGDLVQALKLNINNGRFTVQEP